MIVPLELATGGMLRVATSSGPPAACTGVYSDTLCLLDDAERVSVGQDDVEVVVSAATSHVVVTTGDERVFVSDDPDTIIIDEDC